MIKDNEPRNEELMEEYEYSSHAKKVVAYFLTALAAVLTGDTALYTGNIPIAIIFYTVLLVCVMLIVRTVFREDKIEYEKHRRNRKAISMLAKENEEIRALLKDKADKPVDIDKSNIHPGSRPSIAYQNMVVEREENDDSR